MDIARALRLAGYPVVFAVGEPLWMRPFSYDHHTVGAASFPEWAVAYVVFAVSFHLGASASEDARARRASTLAVMTGAAFTMTALLDCTIGALSFVVLASQAALVLPRRYTALVVAAQTAVLCYLVVDRLGWGDGALSHVLPLVAAEIFAAVAVYLARHADETARDLSRANAELRATRSLLEETSRAHERTRISRELHDVLGHDLAALGLQLEVATHVPPERAGAHVAKAKEVSARLLRNVREVVRETREGNRGKEASDGDEALELDLGRALRALCDDVPGMAVHLAMPAELTLEDPTRGHCLLRCVQEIVTNALKHSHAANLWITMSIADGAITIEARDDGQGADELRAGFGLSGMRARLEELGGWLKVASEPSRAFAVSARLPAPAKAAAS